MEGWILSSAALPAISIEHVDPIDITYWWESEQVLVACRNVHGDLRYGIGCYIREDNGKQYWSGVSEDECDIGYRGYKVISWRPLPPLPEV